MEEAIFFHRKLREAGMPFGGAGGQPACTPRSSSTASVPRGLEDELGDALAGRVAASARKLASLAARDAANVAHLRAALGDPPVVVVPERQDDVHDVEGLAHVRAHLWHAG